jgi:hypothetical protein
MLTKEQWKEWFQYRTQFTIDTTNDTEEERKSFLEVFADIFDITTYDSAMDRYFGFQILEVLNAMATNNVYNYQDQSETHYKNFLMVANLRRVAPLLDWGTSIRGAWIDVPKGGWVLEEYMGNYCPPQGLQPVLRSRDEAYDFIIKAVEIIKEQEAEFTAQKAVEQYTADNPDAPQYTPAQWIENNRVLSAAVNTITESLAVVFQGLQDPTPYAHIEQLIKDAVDAELPKLLAEASYSLYDTTNGAPPPWTLAITAFGQTGYVTIG